MTENTKTCRICLGLISNNICTVVDKTILQMLKMISPSSDVLVDSKSILCNNCSQSLQKSFDFKTTCLNNEIYLKTFQKDNSVKLTLQEIVHKDNVTEDGIKIECECVCRLCFTYFDGTFFTDLARIDDDFFLGDMIEKCLPEINLGSTQDPLMCQDCTHALQNQFNLVSTFLDTNDKINDYVSYTTLCNNNCDVDLRKVLEFTLKEKSTGKNDFFHVRVKEEEEENSLEGGDHSEIYVKVEEDSLFKEEEGSTSVNRMAVVDQHCVKKEIKEDIDAGDVALEKNSDGVYVCPHCQHETFRKDSLALHLLTHESTAPQFKCDKCDFTTKWRTSLHQHSWLHDEVQMYQCSVCPYKTRYKKHLKRHDKRHNPISLPFRRCQYCEFSTTDRTYFKLHNRTKHNIVVKFDDLKTFDCRFCDYKTGSKGSLTEHCKKKHREKSQKKVVCEECGFQATSMWRLNDHKLKHKSEAEVTMLQCAKCSFKTKYKNSLRLHLSRHCVNKKRTRKQES